MQSSKTTFEVPNNRKFMFSNVIVVLITLIIVYGLYAVNEIYPFGNNVIATSDLRQQYLPFFSNLRDKILHGDSFLYSWNGGLGHNYWALFSNYLSSPLNLILLFFPYENLNEGVQLLIALKLALASGTMYFLSTEIIKNSDLKGSINSVNLLAIVFSLIYSISTYSLIYSIHVMWLDALIILPLCVYALICWVQNNNYGKYLYVLFLALLIFSNYYVAFMSCILLFLIFTLIYIRFRECKQTWKDFLYLTLKFFFYSAVAALLCAIVILPTLYNLTLTSKLESTAPETFERFIGITRLFSRLLPFSEPTIKYGAANIYSGIISVLVIPQVITSDKKKSYKIVSLTIYLVLLLSFDDKILNYIFHGFAYPLSFEHRHAFVFIFYSVLLAFDVFVDLKKVNIPILILTMIGSFTLIAIYVSRYDWNISLVSSIIIFLILSLALLGSSNIQNLKAKTGFSYLLVFLILLETLTHSIFTVKITGENEGFYTRTSYLGNTYDEVQEAKLIVEQNKNTKLARTEYYPKRTINDGIAYDLNALSFFSSTYYYNMSSYLETLGYSGNEMNNIWHFSDSDKLSDLLSIEFLIEKKDSGTGIPDSWQIVGSTDTMHVWQNPDVLDLGYYIETLDLDENYNSSLVESRREYQFKVTSISDTEFNGNIYAPEDGFLFLSIPFDEGWSLTRNGEEVALLSAENTFTAIELEEGENEISAYFTPVGFKTGSVISISTLIFLILSWIMNKKKFK